MSSTLTVAAATALAGAFVALVVLPGQRRERAEKRARSGWSRSRCTRDRRETSGAGRPGRRRRGAARGRQARSVKADQAILNATLEDARHAGGRGHDHRGSRRDAGVGKTTIYRRWPTKTALILAAISDLVPPRPAGHRQHGGDMAAVAETQRRRLAGSGLAGIVRACSPSR